MRSAEMREGRVFVLTLEEGEVLHESVEAFCRRNGVSYATVIAVGGAAPGSEFVVGPTVPVGDEIEPLTFTLGDPHELTGTGTVFPDTDGVPVLHMHGSVGREGRSSTGCFRRNMVVWLTMEVVVRELVGSGPVRSESDPRIRAKLLEIR
ncbi:MAG: DNA-binding protein [Candidatus Methanomethylophilaceae archaeon]|nr:DNA-binding protein [Candidatus Methanomethylophilaceae archaeon]